MKDEKIHPKSPTKYLTRYNSSPLPSCFRPPTTTTTAPHAPPPTAATSNITTSLYQTPLGLFSLTWSRSLLSRSLHLHLHHHSLSFQLSLNPFFFWKYRGFTQLDPNPIWVFWDLSKAKFGPGLEPVSGFYIAVVSHGDISLLVGDLEREACLKTRVKRRVCDFQFLVVRREHVFGDRFYSVRSDFGGKSRSILIDLNTGDGDDDPRLVIRFDSKRVLQVKHLRWKFRGSERIEVDGYPIQLSWDVYNWLFDEDGGNQDEGCALFTFRFEKQGNFNGEEERESDREVVMWCKDSFGLNYEKKKLMVKTRSSSSSSISSASSSGCSSVLEWESVEENELKGPTGFTLLVYAWKR